jgi:hypothetical protein
VNFFADTVMPEKELFMDLQTQKTFPNTIPEKITKKDGASRQSIDGPEHVL